MNETTLLTQDRLHYVTAEADGRIVANRVAEQLGAWQVFTVEPDPFGDPHVRVLKTSHGLYLSAYPKEYCDSIGVPHYTVTGNGPAPDAWERWRVSVDGTAVRLRSELTQLWFSPQNVPPSPLGGGANVLVNGPEPNGWETLYPSNLAAFTPAPGPGPDPGPGPSPGPGVVRLIDGAVRQLGTSVQDNGGARLLHGCSDFCAMAKAHEDPDTYLRNLDITAQWQQYTRLGWRVNGWVFAPRNLDIDPMRHPWWESALRFVLQAHRDRGLKVNLSSFDMYNWSNADARHWFQTTAQIAAEYGDTVWLFAVTNEMKGTAPGGESPANVALGNDLLDICEPLLPFARMAISDPDSRDKAGMWRLGRTAALIHQFPSMGRYFNDIYENYPGVFVVDDEPRGPNGPGGGDVTNSIEDPDVIFALYTMGVAVGKPSTYFNSPGCAEREPLDSTWGFKELPRLWRAMEIPEDIGQGELQAGQHAGSMLQVNGSHASRADSMVRGNYGLGGISGRWDGQPWAVRAGFDATYSLWYAAGKTWEGRLSAGQVIPTPPGFTPVIVRALR